MKKHILLFGSLLAAGCAFADEMPSEVTFVEHLFATKISPNGLYAGPYRANAAIYDTQTKEITNYSGLTFGMGNCIANNGVAVGDGFIMYGGTPLMPDALKAFSECDISCITPDATRIAGYVRNRTDENTSVSYIPYVADLDADYQVTNFEFLPFPALDLFKLPPQLVNALVISDDGKTIAGQVWDSYGDFCYPIVFMEGGEGWKYSLPSEETFNPEGIELLLNPYENPDNPKRPSGAEYISDPVKRQAYETAYQNYLNNNGTRPNPEDYMSDEDYQLYKAAIDAYNEWYEAVEPLFQQYLDNYYLIKETSPSFSLNNVVIAPSGEHIYLDGGTIDSNAVLNNKIYEFTTTGVSRIISLENPNQQVNQVLADGTLLVSEGIGASPNCRILLPEATDFISLPEFLHAEHPEIELWVDTNFPTGTGIVSMSEDKSVIIGAVTYAQISPDFYNDNYNFATYIINFNEAGIESLMAEPTDGFYRVYSLQGVKVLETKDASALSSLPRGLYIVNSKKIYIP